MRPVFRPPTGGKTIVADQRQDDAIFIVKCFASIPEDVLDLFEGTEFGRLPQAQTQRISVAVEADGVARGHHIDLMVRVELFDECNSCAHARMFSRMTSSGDENGWFLVTASSDGDDRRPIGRMSQDACGTAGLFDAFEQFRIR